MLEYVEFRFYVCMYIECLSKVYVKLRESVILVINDVCKEVEVVIFRYKSFNDGQVFGFYVYRIFDGKEEWVGFMVEWDDVWFYLVRKNGSKFYFV